MHNSHVQFNVTEVTIIHDSMGVDTVYLTTDDLPGSLGNSTNLQFSVPVGQGERWVRRLDLPKRVPVHVLTM